MCGYGTSGVSKRRIQPDVLKIKCLGEHVDLREQSSRRTEKNSIMGSIIICTVYQIFAGVINLWRVGMLGLVCAWQR
jgi:hypothetical protein